MHARQRHRGALFAALALVLALHPIAGARQASEGALVALLSWLGCSCEACPMAEGPEPERPCCEEPAAPAGDQRAMGGACPCLHPAQVPAPADHPLASSGGSDAAQRLERAASISAHAPLAIAAVASETLRCARPPGSSGRGAPEACGFAGARLMARGAPGLLAALGTALL